MRGKNQGGQCQCSGCGERFNSMGAFDMHRVGEYAKRDHSRRCLSSAEMRASGMKVTDNSAWTTGAEYPRALRAS